MKPKCKFLDPSSTTKVMMYYMIISSLWFLSYDSTYIKMSLVLCNNVTLFCNIVLTSGEATVTQVGVLQVWHMPHLQHIDWCGGCHTSFSKKTRHTSLKLLWAPLLM